MRKVNECNGKRNLGPGFHIFIVDIHSIHLHSAESRFFVFSITSKSFPAQQIQNYIIEISYIMQKHLINENSFARKTGETAFEGEGRVKKDPEKLAAKERHHRVPPSHASSSSSSSSSSSFSKVRSNLESLLIHCLELIQLHIHQFPYFQVCRERGRRERERKIHCHISMCLYHHLFYLSNSFTALN